VQLEGRTALVTGGSGGIGSAACLGFAREGAAVAVHYRTRRDAAERVAAEITGAGGRAVAVHADLTDEGSVARMMERVADFAGAAGLHVLFNNAGIYPSSPLASLELPEWERVFAVNARGPFLCVREALPLLERAQSARVINIGSILVYRGASGFVHYVASKAAVVGLTRALARELAPRGVTVNCVVPSMVETDTTVAMYPGAEAQAVAEQAIKRYQQPEDLLGVLVFLASEASAWMTGQTILADGGRVFL
jgi:NAD(P)-dependent dehydrogenase (short-subunit alcohol dehydrogenase family)